jgi:hypothetical protein
MPCQSPEVFSSQNWLESENRFLLLFIFWAQTLGFPLFYGVVARTGIEPVFQP